MVVYDDVNGYRVVVGGSVETVILVTDVGVLLSRVLLTKIATD